MTRRLALVALALVSSVAPLRGQPTPTCEAGGFVLLEPLVGEWEVLASARVAAGRFEETVGQARIERALGGCALIEHYQGSREGTPFFVLAVFTADPNGGFELARLDSVHGTFTVSVGREDGEAVRFEWSRDLGDRVLRTRQVYRVESQDQFDVERFLSPRDGASWELTSRASYRRKVGPGS